MDRMHIRLTRMRVLCRGAELTGKPGKIERSADALLAEQACTFHNTAIEKNNHRDVSSL